MMGHSRIRLTRVISAVQGSAPHHCLALGAPAGWHHHLELIVVAEHIYIKIT